jgi:PAH dioxygenase large subunit
MQSEITISRQSFWDPEVFEKELQHVFARSWLFVAHESEIPVRGDYVTRRMGANPVIVVRDEHGEARVFLNTCPHRGGQLCRAEMGNTSHFRCSYHGWTLSNKGELRGVPELRQVYPPTFDRKGHSLFAATRVETFAGLIFATFDPDAPPLTEYLGDIGWYLQAYFGKAELEVVAPPTRGILRSNWKVGAENYAGDGYHVTTTHRSPVELGMFGNPDKLAKLGPITTNPTAFCVDAGNGHAVRVQKLPIDFEQPMFLGYPPELWGVFADRLDADQLGANSGLAVAHGDVFPNLSFLDGLALTEPDAAPVSLLHLRQWQPLQRPDRQGQALRRESLRARCHPCRIGRKPGHDRFPPWGLGDPSTRPEITGERFVPIVVPDRLGSPGSWAV